MRTVLIVDDEPDILLVLELQLRDPGYRVIKASDGADSLQKANDVMPDFIFVGPDDAWDGWCAPILRAPRDCPFSMLASAPEIAEVWRYAHLAALAMLTRVRFPHGGLGLPNGKSYCLKQLQTVVRSWDWTLNRPLHIANRHSIVDDRRRVISHNGR